MSTSAAITPRNFWAGFALDMAGVVLRETTSGIGGIFAGVGDGYAHLRRPQWLRGATLEDQADRVGLRYLRQAGYDPMQAPKVWQIINEHAGDRNEIINFF